VRAISDDDRQKLKAATRRAVKSAGGGDSFAHVTRVSESQLSKYGLASDEHQDAFIPVDVALEADVEAGSPIIATALAAAQGFRLVRNASPVDDHSLGFADISQISVAFSSFHTRMHEALADDGRVDEAERRRILKDFDKFMRTLFTTMGRV